MQFASPRIISCYSTSHLSENWSEMKIEWSMVSNYSETIRAKILIITIALTLPSGLFKEYNPTQDNPSKGQITLLNYNISIMIFQYFQKHLSALEWAWLQPSCSFSFSWMCKIYLYFTKDTDNCEWRINKTL